MNAQPGLPRLMRTPRTVNIDITAGCNLRCKYCYFFNNPAVEYRDLPTAEWLTFFDELGRLGVMDVVIAGGEPFSRPDLLELLDGVIRNRMRFSLLSNGGLIDDARAAFLAASGRCNYVQVSVDGACAEVHDKARGRGAFEGAARGIRTLQRHGVPVAARLTIHRHNLADLEAAARFLLEDLGLPSFGTNAAGYLGNCQRNADELMLDTAERSRAMQTLLELEARYPGRITASAGPLAEARSWPGMLRASQEAGDGGWNDFPGGGYLTGCGCTFSELTVRPDGTITPCSMLAHLELGRINQVSLQGVWQNHPVLQEMRARWSMPLEGFESCRGCAFAPGCTGNCPGTGYALTGQVNAPAPDACLRRFLEDGGVLPALPQPDGVPGGQL